MTSSESGRVITHQEFMKFCLQGTREVSHTVNLNPWQLTFQWKLQNHNFESSRHKARRSALLYRAEVRERLISGALVPADHRPKGRVHFHHDARPLKTCHRQFFIRTPAPLGSIWQEGSNQKLSMTSDGVVPRWGLVCRGGRVTKRVFNGRVSWWKCTRPFGVVLPWILENKLPLGVGCSGRIARLMRWNETRTYWLGLGVWFVAAWPFQAEDFSPLAWGIPNWSVLSLSFLLPWKLGVKGNRLNRNGSEK